MHVVIEEMGTLLLIVLASVVIPMVVAWSSTLSAQPFRFWKAHPWTFFWGAPVVVSLVSFVPLAFFRQSQQIPWTVLLLTRMFWFVSIVVILSSAVHGLRLTLQKSPWRAVLVVVFFVIQGAFGLLLSGGPAPILGAPMTDALAIFLTVLFGAVFAGWLSLMAVASGFALGWLTGR